MASSGANASDDADPVADADSEDDTEFLGPGPEESLEMNSSAAEAFSPE